MYARHLGGLALEKAFLLDAYSRVKFKVIFLSERFNENP